MRDIKKWWLDFDMKRSEKKSKEDMKPRQNNKDTKTTDASKIKVCDKALRRYRTPGWSHIAMREWRRRRVKF